MKKDKNNRSRNIFSQSVCKFLNLFTLCSRQSTSLISQNQSYANTFRMSTPVSTRSNIYLSQTRINHCRLKLSFYIPTLTSINQVCYELRILKKKEIVGIYPYPRSSLWHLNIHIFFFVAFICNTLLFICSYAADVKRRVVIFHHHSFLPCLLSLLVLPKKTKKITNRVYVDEHVQTRIFLFFFIIYTRA
jgi:hypothetical protein